jgi:porin
VLCVLALLSPLAVAALGADNPPSPSPSSTPSFTPAALSSVTVAHALSGKQEPISANPAAVDIIPGTGALGRLAGLDKVSGVTLGGLWIGDTDYLARGGTSQGSWSFNSLFILNLNLDVEQLIAIPGCSIDVSMLQFNGQDANGRGGVVTAYDGLTDPPPLNRTQLYELWWRQSLFEGKIVIRVGKTVPTYDFNNVTRAVPTSDSSLQIPALTGLLYTPIFKNPTLIGVSPGYYNSAYGITAQYAPNRHFYLNYAFYDGAVAQGVQTGLKELPELDGHYFTISEAGYAWILGRNGLIGKLAIGGWAQTGELYGPAVKEKGAEGFYTFGSQRFWRIHPGSDNSGISGFFQFGVNDSRTMIANRYVGLGLSGFGLVPHRPVDSIGMGLAWSWLNRHYGFRSNEAILQLYDQIHLFDATFLEPAVSYIPNPGESRATPRALALTVQIAILF